MPTKPAFVYRIHVDGVDRDMTQQEIDNYLATLPDATEEA